MSSERPDTNDLRLASRQVRADMRSGAGDDAADLMNDVADWIDAQPAAAAVPVEPDGPATDVGLLYQLAEAIGHPESERPAHTVLRWLGHDPAVPACAARPSAPPTSEVLTNAVDCAQVCDGPMCRDLGRCVAFPSAPPTPEPAECAACGGQIAASDTAAPPTPREGTEAL